MQKGMPPVRSANTTLAPPPPPPPTTTTTATTAATNSETTNTTMEATLSCLWIVTPLIATFSLLVVIIAMFTNQWLHTEEKMNNPSYNGTGERDYLSKLTISGLWMLCFTNPGETLYDCNKIDYFSKEEYSPDPSDSTMAIPYTVTRSVFFFLAATILLCSGYCCCLLGQCVRQRSLYTFISGVIFIVTGLVMLFGLIMYISIFKAEIGSKLRPKSQLQPPLFVYWYGYSFLLYVSGLITTQLTGICSIFLFIYKLQYEWYRKQIDDLKHGKINQSRSSISTTTTTTSSTVLPQQTTTTTTSTIFHPCRRHPFAYINSNSSTVHLPRNYPTSLLPPPIIQQKRYFFSKEPIQESPCSIHRPLANSLNNLSNFYDFPPPPTISYQFDSNLNDEIVGGIDDDDDDDNDEKNHQFPRDLTLNTLSTTADVNCDDFNNTINTFDDYSSANVQHEFVTFDLDQAPIRGQTNISTIGGGGAINNSANCRKTYESDTLRRTTPV